MNEKFESTAMILDTVWFARDAIDWKNKEINWELIYSNGEQIRPSSTELLRINIAKEFWCGHGEFLEYFIPFDESNRIILLEALKIRLNIK